MAAAAAEQEVHQGHRLRLQDPSILVKNEWRCFTKEVSGARGLTSRDK